MKKTLLIILLMLGMMPIVCNAQEQLHFTITLTISGDDNGNGEHSLPKGPVARPSVAIDGYTLYLYSGCDNTTLRLISSDETEAFSTEVEEGTTSVTLPSNLTGTYELQIVRGAFTFYCYIDL